MTQASATRRQGMSLLPILLAALAQAGTTPPQMLASTSASASLPSFRPLGDAGLLLRAAGQDAVPYLPERAWQALLGDLDGDGFHDLPEGIDALCLVPGWGGARPTVADLRFSTERSGPGYVDGDVLRLAGPGVLEVVHSEAELVALLLPTSGTLDIDALTIGPAGEYLLSLRDNLYGTVLGDLDDGAIVSWQPSSGALALVASEAQVQSWVDAATGTALPIGDLKALSWDASSGELLFTVQSPGDRDATVFGDANGGRVVAGWLESDWGFAENSEIDALALVPPSMAAPILLDSRRTAVASGETVDLQFTNGDPGEGVVALASSEASWLDQGLGGFGVQVAERWGAYTLSLPLSGHAPLQMDARGRVSYQFRVPALPAALIGQDVILQGAGGRSGLSTPLRLRLR